MWSFESTCLPERPEPQDDCQSQTHFAFALEGTVDFRADGTAEFTTRLQQKTYIWIPKRCLPPTQTCANAVTPVPPVVGECVDAGEFCDCLAYTDAPFESEVVSYQTDGAELHVMSSAGFATFDFCVLDDWLRYVHETGESTVARRVH
jgi:hypothetical protein